MLTGIINRRISDRASFHSEVKINFHNSTDEVDVIATATNISAGGMQFVLPAKSFLLNIGEKISFIFQLPDSGEIQVLSEIRYRNIQPNNSDFIAHYGVKFLDFSLENWNSIRNYCELNKAAATTQPPVETLEDKAAGSYDVVKTKLELEDGSIINGVIEDLSFGGTRVNLEQPLKINSCVSLDIYYKKTVLKLKGYCIWCAPEKIAPQAFLAGIFFPSLDQAQFDQLKVLINKTN